jgi:superfamily I DNA/RNA helicase
MSQLHSKPMSNDYQEELAKALEKILQSKSPKRLIVAGPGTGKTTLFRKLLEGVPGDPKKRLVLTFLNNLKSELEEKLSDLAGVFTFHGYCHFLLRRSEELRSGLTIDFIYFPGLASLIKSDWEIYNNEESPKFVGLMRDLQEEDQTEFYLHRANYYDAVEFDDSVFRVRNVLAEHPELVESHEMVLVDEYQDFNRLEASFIDLLAAKSPITIVGDDDQALYSQLRGSSHEFIRSLHQREEYERFELPFCMRCPEVVVGAISDVVEAARKINSLQGRIEKPYNYFPPYKEADSKRYPTIKIVATSTQQSNANYMGKYIVEAIRQIPSEETRESRKEGFPTVLIIGPAHYLRLVAAHLSSEGFKLDIKEDSGPKTLERPDGLAILHTNHESNLGWRIILEVDRPQFRKKMLRQSVKEARPLIQLLHEDYKDKTLAEAKEWSEEPAVVAGAQAEDGSLPTVKLTSFEGSKGLSAQHVFILGLQEEQLPRERQNITDLEICKFIVALTRTRKQCQIIFTRRFSGNPTRPSIFLEWIRAARKEFISVDKTYWEKKK